MRYVGVFLSLMAIAVLLTPYCSGAYYSDVSSTGETTNDSFTVILYSDTNIFNGSISYEVIGGGTRIIANLYTLISGAHLMIYGNATYTLSFEFHIYDENGELVADAYLFINDNPANEVELEPNVEYDIQLNVVFTAISFSGALSCELTLQVLAIHNSCTYDEDGNCATIEVHDDPLVEIIDVTEGEGVEGDYVKTSSTFGGNPQVIISNSTNATGEGVADADGNINIVLNIPANTPFCIRIWNGESYDIRANITINNIMIDGIAKNHKYNNQKLGSGFPRYFCHYTTTGTFGSEYWSTTNLDNVKNNNGWFYSSNGSVTISIDAHYDDGQGNKAQNVRLSVIFRDSVNI